ncbi:hypothetical protein B0T14DRAFT_576402 [Immersiella caudata]|uniref:Uncharacterized protein n=1 Tax=Immersiella caudata TaxID=314043 RepID=A0AA40CE24_9PEZI|nr:hypothetical protein B0T14DRAFT_576402 [Immersiella caudata]
MHLNPLLLLTSLPLIHALAGPTDLNANTLDNLEHACAINFPFDTKAGKGGAQPSIVCINKGEDLLLVKKNNTYYRSEGTRICCPADSVCMQEEFDRSHNYRGHQVVCFSPQKKAILQAHTDEWEGCTPNGGEDGCVDDKTGKRKFYNKDVQKVVDIKGGVGVLDPNFASGTFGDGTGSSGGSSGGSGSSSSGGEGSKSSANSLQGSSIVAIAAALGFAAAVVL